MQPVRKGSATTIAIAVPYQQAEAQGIVKIDILALEVLDQLHEINRRVESLGNPPLSLGGEQLQEVHSRCVLDRALTAGLFQVSKQAELLKNLRVRNIDDLVFASGLIRIMEGRKELSSRPDWLSDLPAPSLTEFNRLTGGTRGLLIFQEQLLEGLVTLGGFAPGLAEEIRRKVAKQDANLEGERNSK